MTPAEVRMVQSGTPTKLYPGVPTYGNTITTATANVQSRILTFTPAVGGFLYVPNNIVPIIKAYKAGPTEVDPDTLFYFGVLKAGKQTADYAPVGFSYHAFADLSAAQQADGTNRTADGTLAVDLGANLLAYYGDLIVVDADGPDALNPDPSTIPGTRFIFQARAGRA